MTPEQIVIDGKTYKLVPVGNSEAATAPSVNNGETSMVGGKKSKKAKRQEGGKTRKLSPYMKFAQEVRPKLVKENPELKSDIPGMGRKIGELWRGLSDSEKARY
jgi:hypothetical protein